MSRRLTRGRAAEPTAEQMEATAGELIVQLLTRRERISEADAARLLAEYRDNEIADYRKALAFGGALDLGPIVECEQAASPAPWASRPHQHPASGCRCCGCWDDPVGWTVDHKDALHCDDLVAKLPKDTNDFGKPVGQCDEGPLLSYEDAEFAAKARDFVPLLVVEVYRLRALLGLEGKAV